MAESVIKNTINLIDIVDTSPINIDAKTNYVVNYGNIISVTPITQGVYLRLYRHPTNNYMYVKVYDIDTDQAHSGNVNISVIYRS